MKTTESQEKQILAHLEKGNGISQMLALKMFDCFRLSARIYRLRKQGKEIYGQLVRHGQKRFTLYYMKNSVLFEIYNA